MGKLYTDTLYNYGSAKPPEEITTETLGNIIVIYLLQGIKAFAFLALVGMLVKLSFFSSTDLNSFIQGYGYVLLVTFSFISSSRFRSGNTLASGNIVGTGSGTIVKAEVDYMRKNRTKVASYYLWLLIYGTIMLILSIYL